MRGLFQILGAPFRFIVGVLHAAIHAGAYRGETKDREEWLASLKANLTATHEAEKNRMLAEREAEKERMLSEFAMLMDQQVQVTREALNVLEKSSAERAALEALYDRSVEAALKSGRDKWNVAMADLLDATTVLAIKLAFDTPEAQREMLDTLRPPVAKATAAIIRHLETSGKPDYAVIRMEALRVLIPPASDLRALMTDPDR
jgi:hypothetical protein